MNKHQLWTEVQELLVANKANKALTSALEELLKPKTNNYNAPQEIDGVMHYYCRFHQAYEPEHNTVMSKDKSKGYCKAAISIWNKRNSAIKTKEAEIGELVILGDFKQAKECSEELQAMKAELNDPASFNLEEDWAAFTK